MTTLPHGTRASRTTRVLLVDDHPIVRRGLAELIDQEPGFSVCGEAQNAQEALDSVAALQPDLAVVDVSLQGTSGIELIKDVKIRYPDMLVLVLSMHDETLYAERVLRAGARGYVMKEEATEKLMTAIRKVLSGQIYLSEKMAARALSKFIHGARDTNGSPLECLSDRELQVFELIGRGRGTRQIAETLHLSVKTIESHREHIKSKLNLTRSTELMQHAIQWVQGERPS
jgi:DNA-binding NarL/FixJ family response regulator